jgi:hypothetical protein
MLCAVLFPVPFDVSSHFDKVAVPVASQQGLQVTTLVFADKVCRPQRVAGCLLQLRPDFLYFWQIHPLHLYPQRTRKKAWRMFAHVIRVVHFAGQSQCLVVLGGRLFGVPPGLHVGISKEVALKFARIATDANFAGSISPAGMIVSACLAHCGGKERTARKSAMIMIGGARRFHGAASHELSSDAVRSSRSVV